jgi:hypothetical protein
MCRHRLFQWRERVGIETWELHCNILIYNINLKQKISCPRSVHDLGILHSNL